MTQPSTNSGLDPRVSSTAPKRKIGSRFTSGHLLMVISGLLAFLLTIVALGARGEKITVYVAKDDIVAGKLLTQKQFDEIQIPSSSLNSKYVSLSTLKAEKSYSSRTILEGEPLTKASLTPESDKTDVLLMSIPIDKSLAVGGNISRGDRIDIIATPGDACAYRALSNLEVIATPGSSSSGGVLSSGAGKYVITVAIEDSGDDLTLAGVIGAGNFQIVKTTGIDSDDAVLEDELCGSAPIGEE